MPRLCGVSSCALNKMTRWPPHARSRPGKHSPPSFCNCSPTSPWEPSIYSCAPSLRAKSSLSALLLMATTRYPILFAYCSARWPRPPSPWTPTSSPWVIFCLRKLLNTVIPAHRMGQYSAGSTSEGTSTTASVRRSTYSA